MECLFRERFFFMQALTGGFAEVEDLFYKFGSEYYAYIKKNQRNNDRQTLQSRNSLIGNYTETWCEMRLREIAKKKGMYAIKHVICPEIGLSKHSTADIAICISDEKVQRATNIKLIIEVKMSIVNNYKYISNSEIELIGDYKTHKGTPSILRSDSMLKAIGKAINIRVSGDASTNIPIIIIGNSPITTHYVDKVDFLKTAGVIQGFYSFYPDPSKGQFVNITPGKGFQTINKFNIFEDIFGAIIDTPMNYFSSMLSRERLGEIITIANAEESEYQKAVKFLTLIKV
jgi:hypothetical protein